MTVPVFITLLTAFATVTGMLTEAVKKILDEYNAKYSANLIACAVAAVVGIGGTAAFYALGGVEFNAVNICCMILMGIATAVGAMVGYDKVVQMIEQFKGSEI